MEIIEQEQENLKNFLAYNIINNTVAKNINDYDKANKDYNVGDVVNSYLSSLISEGYYNSKETNYIKEYIKQIILGQRKEKPNKDRIKGSFRNYLVNKGIKNISKMKINDYADMVQDFLIEHYQNNYELITSADFLASRNNDEIYYDIENEIIDDYKRRIKEIIITGKPEHKIVKRKNKTALLEEKIYQSSNQLFNPYSLSITESKLTDQINYDKYSKLIKYNQLSFDIMRLTEKDILDYIGSKVSYDKHFFDNKEEIAKRIQKEEHDKEEIVLNDLFGAYFLSKDLLESHSKIREFCYSKKIDYEEVYRAIEILKVAQPEIGEQLDIKRKKEEEEFSKDIENSKWVLQNFDPRLKNISILEYYSSMNFSPAVMLNHFRKEKDIDMMRKFNTLNSYFGKRASMDADFTKAKRMIFTINGKKSTDEDVDYVSEFMKENNYPLKEGLYDVIFKEYLRLGNIDNLNREKVSEDYRKKVILKTDAKIKTLK